MRGAAHVSQVNPIEDHRQRGCIELNLGRPLDDQRKPKPAALETFVIDHEAASIPEEDLHPVRAPAKEDEEMPRVRIVTELRPHRRAEPVVAAAKVDRRDSEEDPEQGRWLQHDGWRARASAAT